VTLTHFLGLVGGLSRRGRGGSLTESRRLM
jgi:hypothetical protein